MNPLPSPHEEPGSFVQANGLRLYIETHGTGTPIILIHGGLETCRMWDPAIPALSANYKLITPDSRGHGRSDNPTGQFSYPLMATDMVQLIQALGIERPFIAGYSDGGQVALEMAIAYPGLARGFLIGGIYNTLTDAWNQMMCGPLGFDAPGVVDFERVAQLNSTFITELREKHEPYHQPGYWKTLLTGLSSSWLNPPNHSPADFAKIVDPSLFWCGDRDVFCPPEQSLEMYRIVKGAELAVFPDADHFTIANQFDGIVAMMQNFITKYL
ncbi:MAG: alpha/beta hydrolase [Anaerolineales bacterium]|nr:alpha/beta hydrolase [Anaerolineales bacterium]